MRIIGDPFPVRSANIVQDAIMLQKHVTFIVQNHDMALILSVGKKLFGA
jgi:hypothetical protein